MVYVVVHIGEKKFKLLSNEKVFNIHHWIIGLSFLPVIRSPVPPPYYNVILSDEAYIRVFLWMWYAVNEQYALLPKLTLYEMMVILPKMNKGRGTQEYVHPYYVELWWNELFSGRYHPGSKVGLGIWPDYKSPLAEAYRETLEGYYLQFSSYRNRIHTNLYPPGGEEWDVILHPVVKLTIIDFKLRQALLRLGSKDILGHLLTFLFSPNCKEMQLALPLGIAPKYEMRGLRGRSSRSEGEYELTPVDTSVLISSITNGFIDDNDEIYCSYTMKIGDMIVWGEPGDVTRYNGETVFWTGKGVVPPEFEGDYGKPPFSLPSNNLGSAIHFHHTVGEDRYCWFDARGYNTISHLISFEEKLPYTGYGHLTAEKVGDNKTKISLKVTVFTPTFVRLQDRRWCIVSEVHRTNFNDRFLTYLHSNDENLELPVSIMDIITRYDVKAQYLLIAEKVKEEE